MKYSISGLRASILQRYANLKKYAKTHPRRSVALAIAVAVIALPAIIQFWLLVTNSVNVPFWDQWVYADLINKSHHGQLTIGDLWHQHNEHRIFIPKLVIVSLANLTGWNVRIDVMMNFAIGLTSFLLLTNLLRRTFANRTWAFLAAAFMSAWLFFSPVQYINWIWGFQMAFFISVLAAVFTVWSLTKYDPKQGFTKWFFIALAAALITTYSLGNGMIIWAVGVGILWMKSARRPQQLTWIITGIAAICLYFYHLSRPHQPSPLWLLRHRFHDLTEYTLQYLGRNLGFTPHTARNMGIALLVLAVISLYILWRKKQLAFVTPWLGLGAYGLVTAMLAAFTRMYEFGVDHSMSHSYTTISVLFVISVITLTIYSAGLLLEKAKPLQLRRGLIVAFGLGLLVFPAASNFWNNYDDGISQTQQLGRHFGRVRHCVFFATEKTDPCLEIVYPIHDDAVHYVNTMRDMNWDHIRQEGVAQHLQ